MMMRDGDVIIMSIDKVGTSHEQARTLGIRRKRLF